MEMIFSVIAGIAVSVLEYLIFFLPNDHFFEGDTIHWFYLRHPSFKDFLLSFFSLDPAGWYRPLTNRTVQSLFYPFFGLDPAGYRVVHFVLFMAAIFAVYKLAAILTNRRLAASIATLFFGVHTINAFTTFDVLFTPEVVYTFFYISAVAAYLRKSLALSVVFFVLSLFSKETAVTLPAMLVVLDVVLNRKRWTTALAGARAHFMVLGIYAALVLGYLGVQRPAFQSIFARPGPEISYRFALDRTILDNADLALTWSFNIPRGWQTDSRNLRGWMLAFLQGFRVLVAGLAVWLLFRPERRLMIAGVLWFFIAVSPGLPLFDHFLPYYLFLPLAGLSLAVGTVFDAAYRAATGLSPRFAKAAMAMILSVLTGICAYGARNDARNNNVLGRSSRLALNSMKDLKAAHPVLHSNTTIYISDADEPNLAWHTSQGELFKMSYGDDSIHTLYWSWGEVISKGVVERGPVVVMQYRDFHLFDVTREFLAASAPLVSYLPVPQHRMEVYPTEAGPGQQYRLSISGLANANIDVHYTREGGPVESFAVHLDERQQAVFDVTGSTAKGLYRFVGFRMPDSDQWVQAAASIRIQ